MVKTGILTKHDRVELIRGEILEKMSIGDPHCACDTVVVSVRNPVRLDDSVPEPDIMLLKPRDDFYGGGKPRPADVLLLVLIAGALTCRCPDGNPSDSQA